MNTRKNKNVKQMMGFRIWLTLLMLFFSPITGDAQTYLLDVGVEQYLAVPNVSVGYVDHAVWACESPNITFVQKDAAGAIIKINSYFDKAATVELVYVVKYLNSQGQTRQYTGYTYYNIQCKGTAPTIVPSVLTMKVGETYQLNVSSISNQSTVEWESYFPTTARVSDSGLVTARKAGTTFIFATVPNLSSPLTCTVYVKDTKMSINANCASGFVDRGTEVSLSSNKTNALIYYSLDGSSPEYNGLLYTNPIVIDKNVTLKAIAYDSDGEKEPSDLLIRDYSVIETDASAVDNILYIDDCKVFAGDEISLSVKMKNNVPISDFQFNLYLPQGVTAVKNDKGKYQVSLCADRLEDGDNHTVSVIEQSDGSLQFICNSEYNEAFMGRDGGILNIKLKVAESVQRGVYTITLKNIKLTERNKNKYYETSMFKSELTVYKYILGDINGDQEVNLYDYNGIANYIHGNPVEGFIEKVGDVDGNGIIDVSDYIGVANLIHTGSIYGDALIATISTNTASNIGENGAQLNGNLTVTSATKTYTVGFFVASQGTPSANNYIRKMEAGTNVKGAFASTISGLSYSTTYYYCSYILYDGVYYYGETKSFTTTNKTTFAVGDLYPNNSNPIGVVFYVSNNGKSGKIVSLSHAYKKWKEAKQWAEDYGYGWRLPTKSELLTMSSIYYSKLSDYIVPGFYWSSTVYSSDIFQSLVYIVTLGSDSGYSNGYSCYVSDDNGEMVIAVKSF